jgi:hypothetical protein
MTNNVFYTRCKPVRLVVMAIVNRMMRVAGGIRVTMAETRHNLLGLVGVNWWEPSGWRLSPILSPEYDNRRIGLTPALAYSFAVIPQEKTTVPSFKNT